MYYTLTALLLSPAWIVALVLAPWINVSIHSGMNEVFSLPQIVIYVLFPVISVGLALRYKEWLIRCEGKERIIPAIFLPMVAAFCFALACGISSHTLREDPNGGFFGAIWYAFGFMIISCYVTIPMGIFSHACLLKAYCIDQKSNSNQAW